MHAHQRALYERRCPQHLRSLRGPSKGVSWPPRMEPRAHTALSIPPTLTCAQARAQCGAGRPSRTSCGSVHSSQSIREAGVSGKASYTNTQLFDFEEKNISHDNSRTFFLCLHDPYLWTPNTCTNSVDTSTPLWGTPGGFYTITQSNTHTTCRIVKGLSSAPPDRHLPLVPPVAATLPTCWPPVTTLRLRVSLILFSLVL